MREWIRECCYQDELTETRIQALLGSYGAWCEKGSRPVQSVRYWGLWMRRHYLRQQRQNGTRYTVYIGIGLRGQPTGKE